MTEGYICGLCGYATFKKQSYRRHLARKTPCAPAAVVSVHEERGLNKNDTVINENGTVINENGTASARTCDLCGKEFKNVNTCRSHKSRGACQEEKNDPCKCTRCLKVFKNPNSKRSHMSRSTCTRAVVPAPPPAAAAPQPSVQITGNNNTVNNVTIVVNNYGDEATGYISQDEAALVRAIRAGPAGLQDMIKRIYFNEDHPENHTVHQPNLARQICQTWDANTKSWKYKPIDEVTYDVLYKAAKPLHEFYSDRSGRNRGFENMTKAIQSSPGRPDDRRPPATPEDRKVYRKLVKDTRCTLLNGTDPLASF